VGSALLDIVGRSVVVCERVQVPSSSGQTGLFSGVVHVSTMPKSGLKWVAGSSALSMIKSLAGLRPSPIDGAVKSGRSSLAASVGATGNALDKRSGSWWEVRRARRRLQLVKRWPPTRSVKPPY
jgi:hypothetical protein